MSELWNPEDDERSSLEGWGIFDVSGNSLARSDYELQRIDMVDVFASDEAAWLYVWDQAVKGSDLHRRALNFLLIKSRPHWMEIEAFCMKGIKPAEIVKSEFDHIDTGDLLRELRRRGLAVVAWCPADMEGFGNPLETLDSRLDQCRKSLEDRGVEQGWAVIETVLGYTGQQA